MDGLFYFLSLILCLTLGLGATGMTPGKNLYIESYHLCNRTKTKTVTKTVAYQKPYEINSRCGWIPWRLCPQTYYHTEYRSVEVPENMTVKECCAGYEPVGQYCALTFDRTSEFASRPGLCPSQDMVSSNKTCTLDIDCPGIEKCCRSYNGSFCTSPISEGLHRTSKSASRPGMCPADDINISNMTCANDSDCPGLQRCCHSTNASICSSPTSAGPEDRRQKYWYQATVQVKMEFGELKQLDPQFLNHTRLLHSMVTGALWPFNSSVHHVTTVGAQMFTTESQILIGLFELLHLTHVTAKLQDIVRRIPEVIDINVKDLNECAHPELHSCSKGEWCINVEGSYNCTAQHEPLVANKSRPGDGHKEMMGSPPGLDPLTTISQPFHERSTVPVFNASHAAPGCYCSEIMNHSIYNVTGSSFQMSWGINSSMHHLFHVELCSASGLNQTKNTTDMKMELSNLEAGHLYHVSIHYSDCQGHRHNFTEKVKTDAEIMSGSLRITNYNFTKEFNNTNSSTYQNFVQSLQREIKDALSDRIPNNAMEVTIASLKSGSIIVDYLVILKDPNFPANISSMMESLASLKRSKVFKIDPNSMILQDFNECALPDDNDCSAHALCIDTDGSYTCKCNPGFKDMAPSRPGRKCEGNGVAVPTTKPEPAEHMLRSSSMAAASTIPATHPTFKASEMTTTNITRPIFSPMSATEKTTTKMNMTGKEHAGTQLYPNPATGLIMTNQTMKANVSAQTEVYLIPAHEHEPTKLPLMEKSTSVADATHNISHSWQASAHELETGVQTKPTAPLSNSTMSTMLKAENHTDNMLRSTTQPNPILPPMNMNSSSAVTKNMAMNLSTPTLAQNSTDGSKLETIKMTSNSTVNNSSLAAPDSAFKSTSLPLLPSNSTSSTSTGQVQTSLKNMASSSAEPPTTLTSTTQILKVTSAESKGAPSSLRENSHVECSSTFIVLSINKTYLRDKSIAESSLMVGRPNCNVNSTENEKHVTITVVWTENCTEMHTNKTHTVVSAILLNNNQPGQPRLYSNVSCVFENEILTSSGKKIPWEVTIDESIGGGGAFEAELQLFSGDFPVERNGTINRDEEIRITVGIKTEDNILKVVLIDCWASTSGDPSDPDRHPFINGSCKVQGTHTSVEKNGEDKQAVFSTKIFANIDAPVAYLHCKLHICKESFKYSCKPDCTGGRAVRVSNSGEVRYAKSGPWRKAFSSPENQTPDSALAPGYVALIFFAVFGVISAVATVGLYRFYRRTGRYDFKPNRRQREKTKEGSEEVKSRQEKKLTE